MRNIKSIPYLGKENNIIMDYILNKEIESEICTNLYDFVNFEDIHNILVIIDNKWLTWLDDIVFNYRDKKCYIHYWKYDVMPLDENLVKRDINQYLLEENGQFYIRYNFEYCELNIGINSQLAIYNLNTEKKEIVHINSWIYDNVYSIDTLYSLYIESSFYDDIITKDREYGRYFIDRFDKKLSNRELKLRKMLELDTFKNNNHLNKNKDYRDVRNFKIEEIQQKYGLVNTLDCYKDRRLKFDSFLYCILRADIYSDNAEFNKEFNELKNGKHIIKYGNNIKLIFKDYWLNNIDVCKYKTWMRMNRHL